MHGCFFLDVNAMKNLMTFDEAQKALSISAATLRNWVRLGKIEYITENGRPYFFADVVADFSEHSSLLKARRNKTKKTGTLLAAGYIENSEVNTRTAQTILAQYSFFSETEIRLILAGFALKLLRCRAGEPESAITTDDVLNPKETDLVYAPLVAQIAGEAGEIFSREKVDFCLSLPVEFHAYEDLLGFLYVSLKNVAERKAKGMYFTPSAAADKLLDSLPDEIAGQTLCDPCCGSGNFLLKALQRGAQINDLHGSDTDVLCVAAARFNLALAAWPCSEETVQCIQKNIVCADFLKQKDGAHFDIIVGNPPWGSTFSAKERNALANRFVCAEKTGADACDLFTEKAVRVLRPNGTLAFVLPQAVLTVEAHSRLRTFLYDCCSVRRAVYLDKAFCGVTCPCVLLTLQKSKNSALPCRCAHGEKKYAIGPRPQRFAFLLHCTDEECAILEKSENVPCVYLKEGCTFALGIVTGDNRRLVLDHPEDGAEPVLRGSDIAPFTCSAPKRWLHFAPQRFQQTAPEAVYRAPEKIVYNFIGQHVRFALDREKRLTLNSCNILLPKLDGIDTAYLLAVLNSSFTAFYLQKRFASLKLLRAHLESLPIAKADEAAQKKLAAWAEPFINGRRTFTPSDRRTLDEMVFALYGFTPQEQMVILSESKPEQYK